MSTTNSKPWVTEPESRPPKVEPWMAFGLALVVAVAAILFAAGTWIVRSNQSHAAVARAVSLREQLQKAEAERDALQSTSSDQAAQITSLTVDRQTAQDGNSRTAAELESVKRELAGVQQSLDDGRQADVSPRSLPTARLKQAMRDKAVVVSAHVDDDKQELAEGALIDFVKQHLREGTTGFNPQDQGPTTLMLSVVAVTTPDNLTSVSVLLEMLQDWKVPGEKGRLPVSIWRNHTVGVTTRERVNAVVEDIVDSLLKSLEAQLAA